MPKDEHEMSYPLSISYRGEGKLHHKHNKGWLHAVFSKKTGKRRMFIRLHLPRGEVMVWISVGVCKQMILFLERDEPLSQLRLGQRKKLHAPYKKNIIKKKE